MQHFTCWSDWIFYLCGIDRCKHMALMQWLMRITACSSSHTSLEEKSAMCPSFYSWREQVRCRLAVLLCFLLQVIICRNMLALAKECLSLQFCFSFPCLSRNPNICLQHGVVLVRTITSHWSPPSSSMLLQTRQLLYFEEGVVVVESLVGDAVEPILSPELECRIVEQHLCPRGEDRWSV